MQCDRLGSLRLDRRSELQLAMMRRHKVQEVQAHVLRRRKQSFPLIGRKLPPERVHELDPDADVAEELTAKPARDVKPALGRTHLPQLPSVVKKDPRQE